MIWLRIQANVATQRKFMDAGPVACWLWLASLGHCRVNLTDGFVAKKVVPALVPGLKGAYRHAAKLVSVGLWHDDAGGYRVKDFLEWNPSKEQIESLRQQDRDRKSKNLRQDSVKIPDGIQATTLRAGAISVSDSLSVSGDLVSEREGNPTGQPPAWNQNGRTARRSALMGDHRRCDPITAAACARGVCVPAFMVSQWRSQLRTEHPDNRTVEAVIRSVIAGELSRHGGGAIGDDPLNFWRAAWRAKHGSRAPQSQNAAAHTLEAARAFKQAVDAEAETFIELPKLEDKK